jgi:hypothetical protein
MALVVIALLMLLLVGLVAGLSYLIDRTAKRSGA